MYEESTAVPLIVSGPDLPRGRVVGAPVSLIDMYRTVADAVGLTLPPEDEVLPSRSIWPAVEDESAFVDRAVLSEYHAAAAITGTFMIRCGRWKYIHHVGHRPELYDLQKDPGETCSLAAFPDYRDVLVECEGRLRSICDPDAVNRQAFQDQAKKIAEHGGIEAIKKPRRLRLHARARTDSRLRLAAKEPPLRSLPGASSCRRASTLSTSLG